MNVSKFIWFAMLLFLSGCVMTTGSYRPPPIANVEQPTVHFYRFALLYPFEVADVTMPGGVRIGSYKTDGGGPGLATVITSGGELVTGTLVKKGL